MNMLNRIGKIAEAAWHDAMQHIDKGGCGRDQAALKELEQRYDEALQQAFRLRQLRMDAEELAQLRGEQAELAMRAGEEEMARIALLERQRQLEACELYRTQYASCQDEVLALAEALRQLRAELAAEEERGGSQAPRQDARDTLRELEVAGRELGREALQAVREAGRLSRETLKEAGGNLQQEWQTLQRNMQQERQHRRDDPRGRK
ncbi:PspA/IM30 family protein [Paenibacillus aestuarii]|uniref:PspA/IM30 family protein n=1 Tax=Paenibacillus aestuarii TaxID=516965 RepID=A0ABW0KFM8_9BACL|nr:hypothetical protein [Paenibacillus aestuarii]